ncbi:MAG TPA: beta-L-arabinofuranosidase domain-containing protein [Planctomycetota bacterium]|nr:beta-L-arabinofuranosidase domain-containing protein [Planctomycetota bacterium]
MPATAPQPALAAAAFTPLPTGAVKPAGWLAKQLRAQADGLTGHLDAFWPSIRDSAWVGGPGDAWERGPYWLDGLVPLAFQLDDQALIAKARRWIDHILDHQHADGWLGPLSQNPEPAGSYRYHDRDPWPRFVLLKVLIQWHEATDDARVVPAMQRFLRNLVDVLAARPLREWATPRWCDLAWCAHWLHDRTGEAWILDLARTAHDQGLDWTRWAERFAYRGQVTQHILRGFERETGTWLNEHFSGTHGVNVAMGLKAPAVWWRQARTAAERGGVAAMLRALDASHGQAHGLFSCDEHLAGTNPSQGCELCTVVEAMFSLEVALATFGDVALADRLERIAFNCLPATISPDFWSHQYDQQANQVRCAIGEDRVYTNNSADANLFGLEPNFGCCTANMHQGWPKFTAHLWLRAADGGLAAASYAPCALKTTVAGAPVELAVDGGYPFAEDVAITLRAAAPVDVPLHLRIPTWAVGATIEVGGRVETATAGTFHRLVARVAGTAVVRLRLPMATTIERRFQNSAAVQRGPLTFALRIDAAWKRVRGADPAPDYELHPTTPWNYAIDPASLRLESSPVGDRPLTPDGAPVRLHAKARRLPGWGIVRNAADVPPPSPVTSTEPLEGVVLVPYGCTHLRVTELPTLA